MMKKVGMVVILVFFSLFIPMVTSAALPQTGHPYLLYHNISEVPGYQYRMLEPWKGWEASVISSADDSLSLNFSADLGDDDNIGYRGKYARDLSLAYQITKKSPYALKAREALLNMEVGSNRSTPSYAKDDRSLALAGYSLAYDWVQPTLDPATDIIIRDKLATLGDTVYKDCNENGTRLGTMNFGQQAQAYPTLGVASAVLYDYTNPNNLSFSSTPATWHRVGREYLFENDLLHTHNRSLFSYGFDEVSGKHLNGAYKSYVTDDLALWFQVSDQVYGENLLNTYPAAKKAFTSEVWESLPNHYGDNYVTNGNAKWVYHKTIISLLPDNEKSMVLNHINRIENSTLLPHSGVSGGGSQGGISPAFLYCVYGNYAAIPRAFPAATSHLDPNAITQVFRGSWNDDADWLSLITFNISTGSNRDAQHHDQLAFEYYSRGDLLLADAGEDRFVLDDFGGTGVTYHNTIAIENPRSPFPASPYTGSSARGIYKGDSGGVATPPTVDTIIQTPWIQALQAQVTITKVSNDTVSYAKQSLSSPIHYSRTILYPESDYFIVVDRMEGTETWTYRNLFRPTSLMATPTIDANKDGVYVESEVGHVNGDLSINTTPYNWQALPYKTETTTGKTTSTISWVTRNPYGKDVRLDIVSAPASEILVTKHVGRIGGTGPVSEVFNPVVYLKSPPATSLYRVTALLSRYTTEDVKSAGPIPVQGTGSAIVVQSSLYEDFIYTGTGNSTFNRFSTDAEIAYIRVHRDKTEITLLKGSYLEYQNEHWVNLSHKTDYLTIKTDGNSTEYWISKNQEIRGSLFPDTNVKENYTSQDVSKDKTIPQNIFATIFMGGSLFIIFRQFLKKE